MFSNRVMIPSSATALFSAYASVAASTMLIRSMANEIIPQEIRSYISSAAKRVFKSLYTELVLQIDEFVGLSRNEVYDAAELYLRTKIPPSVSCLRVSKLPRQASLAISTEKGELIPDEFDGVKLTWQLVCIEQEKKATVKKHFEITFDKKFRSNIIDSYLPYVLKRADSIRVENRVVKLYGEDCVNSDSDDDDGGNWGSVKLEHPSTFETLAMEPEAKKAILDDLDRFLGRRDFYKKVGRAWKRGYLLYGPPGTGKSSLIAAMANYLKFDVYDVELASIDSNSELRRTLLATTNRSILVIEDIDCSVELKNRDDSDDDDGEGFAGGSSNTKLTLSGLLNFIDGLWSSCGDERIIVFTTNHKDRLDPALLRPGRMDMHIHMSYCTKDGFKILANNYLGIQGNEDQHKSLYTKIEGQIAETEVTPAEVAEELMKSGDADVALRELFDFLKRKRTKIEEKKEKMEEVKETVAKEENEEKLEDEEENTQNSKKLKRSENIGKRAVRGRSRRRY